MTKQKMSVPKLRVFPLYKLLPSIITLTAVCFGLTAVKCALDTKWESSIILLLLAAFLDGMDGRVARYLKVTSDFGAELDSLADFCNFGIAPGLVLYMWAADDLDVRKIGWGVVLVFAMCCAVRLARFNTNQRKKDSAESEGLFFTGIPAPIGGILLIMPIISSFEFKQVLELLKMPLILGIYMIAIALAMASRIPTFAIKKMSVSQENVALFLAFIGFVIAGLLIKPWLTITVMSVLYLFSIPYSVFLFYKNK
ncbi:MAG: CDP-diacylglycerol--serine O-phosphatidyltransferase [Rickettsiales bacterium]|nr:CDP-diacylglycerol--serine O-phosphatidyltransferase [Rickettsiales bacterium]